MFREADRLKSTDIFTVFRKEEVLVGSEELLGILRVEGSDKVQKRVDKQRPEDASQFRLHLVSI